MKNDPVVEVRQIKSNDILNLENLIKGHMEQINKIGEEIKQTREMFEDSFSNNPTYREHEKKVKEATKAKQVVRSQIRKQPSVATLEQKLKDLRFDQKELKKTLSGLLLDYKNQTRATQLELFNGEIFEIVESAKVVRAKSKFK